jgi:hypothetical protein
MKMSIVRDIEENIENVLSEMKWLKTRIEEVDSSYVNDEEVDFGMVYSQYENADDRIDDLISKVKDLIENLKDLI